MLNEPVPLLMQIVTKTPTKRQLRQFLTEHRKELEKLVEGDVSQDRHNAICHDCHDHVDALNIIVNTTTKE